jgi:hypothetical protein
MCMHLFAVLPPPPAWTLQRSEWDALQLQSVASEAKTEQLTGQVNAVMSLQTLWQQGERDRTTALLTKLQVCAVLMLCLFRTVGLVILPNRLQSSVPACANRTGTTTSVPACANRTGTTTSVPACANRTGTTTSVPACANRTGTTASVTRAWQRQVIECMHTLCFRMFSSFSTPNLFCSRKVWHFRPPR